MVLYPRRQNSSLIPIPVKDHINRHLVTGKNFKIMLCRLVKEVVLLCLDVYVINIMDNLQLQGSNHVEKCIEIFSGAQLPQFLTEV
jgi:hypothetical protein